MDVRNLEYQDSFYDAVIDKACLDCLFCGENFIRSVQQALNEIYRVLKEEGIYLFVSNAPPS